MKKIVQHPVFQFLLLIVTTAALIYQHYRAIFENFAAPKTTDIYRDGIKTVLNTIYHARYNPSYTWYQGMNYPYEEHIVAATEMPGVALVFKFLYPWFPGLTDYTFGIIHLILLAAILLAAIFIYLIFKELKIPFFLAIPFAIAITFLAPQNLRFPSHMGLAPLFVLPSVFYFLLKIELTQKWKYSLYLAITTFISSFLHFYFFAVIAIFVSLYFLVAALSQFNVKNIKNLSLQFATGIGIPLLFFLVYMIGNDRITDRSPNPYGFFVYHSNFTNLFSSPHVPWFTWLNDRWFEKTTVDFEGWAYIGLIADFFLVILLLKWLFNLCKKPVFNFLPQEFRPYFSRLLIAGGIMAYLSCSQPFIMSGWEYLLEFTGPYKQFRSTGRFAWAFYFAINIISFTGFYYLVKNIRHQWLKGLALTAIVSVSLFEAWTFHNTANIFRSYELKTPPELEAGKEFTTVTDIEFSKYQAIVPVPLFLVGSNNIELPGSAYIVQQALVLSVQTGLPVTGAMLTRSSHRQAFNQLQLVSPPYRYPAIFAEYKNDKPLLLLVSHTNKKEDAMKFGHLLDESTLLHQTEKWSLYEMELNAFQKRIDKKINKIKAEITGDSLFQVGDFLSTDSTLNFVYQNFDTFNIDNPYLGPGQYKGHAGLDNYLFIGKIPNANPDSLYHFSIWVDVRPDRFATTTFRITEQLANGHTNIVGQNNPAWGHTVFDPRGWVLLEIPFRISGSDVELTVYFKKQEDYDRRWMSVDEMLIKPAGTNLYRQEADFIWKNNQVFYTPGE